MAEKKTILIVDDDDLTRETYVKKFQSAGFEVMSARDGLEALERISEKVPHIVFTGIIMPRMSGFDLVEHLRKDVKTSRLPVVMSSHLGRKEDLERARALGILDFIIKGEVTLDEAVERINRVLGKRFIYQVGVARDKYDAHALAEAIGADPAFVCSQCGGDLVLSVEYFPKEERFSIQAVCSVCGKINSR